MFTLITPFWCALSGAIGFAVCAFLCNGKAADTHAEHLREMEQSALDAVRLSTQVLELTKEVDKLSGELEEERGKTSALLSDYNAILNFTGDTDD